MVSFFRRLRRLAYFLAIGMMFAFAKDLVSVSPFERAEQRRIDLVPASVKPAAPITLGASEEHTAPVQPILPANVVPPSNFVAPADAATLATPTTGTVPVEGALPAEGGRYSAPTATPLAGTVAEPALRLRESAGGIVVRPASPRVAAQTIFKVGQTRASNLGAIAVGVGQIMHIADFMDQHPNCRTAILCYLRLDSDDIDPLVATLRSHTEILERRNRPFWPQISLETGKLNMAEFRRELARPGSQVARSVRILAREIAYYRDRQKWFFLRPFCEMNDDSPNAAWEFGNAARHNTPQDFAAAWKALREAFDAEGATNAIFVFSPLAAHNVHHEHEVLETLNRIPVGYIDAFGLNVYSRPLSAYGGRSPEPIAFETLAKPWLALLARSKQRGIPRAVPEMGISSQADDARRAVWLRQAFGFARAHGFVLLTYFNFPHRYWQVHENTRAGAALNDEINRM